MTTPARRLLSQINRELPQHIPTEVVASGIDCSSREGDTIYPGRPGTEARYIEGDHEYAFVSIAVTDHDYLGQHLFIQIAHRAVPATTAFSEWRWAFYYRRGDTGWDTWVLDVNFDTEYPTYAQFGQYVDDNLTKEVSKT